jgi:hypothetical protein
VRHTRYRLLVHDSRVPIGRRRVITADASLGPRLAGMRPYLPAPGANTRLAYRLAGGRKVVAAVMAAVCCTGTLKVTHRHGRPRHGRPCGADTSDVVSVDQIGKREEPTTNVCDEHT